MRKNISILIFLLLFTVIIYSQQDSEMDKLDDINNIEDFLQQGKKSIIDLAHRQLEKNDSFENFDIDLFNNFRVYYDEDYVWVSFSQSVRFVPWNSAFAYEVTIFLYGQQGTSCSLLENPGNQNTGSKFSFYQYSGNDRDMLAKILKIIKIDPENSLNNTVTIYDNPEYFNIEIMNEYSGEFFKIRKSDMTFYDEWSEEFDLSEEKNGDTKELK